MQINVYRKIYIQMGYIAFKISKEDWELIYLGAGTGLIIDNWTNKGYQPGGKIVYVKKNAYGYDVVVIDKNGKSIISVIAGNGNKGVKNSLKTLDDVKRMMKNNGGFFISY